MSSKNRAYASIPSDAYPTPPWAVHRLLEQESVQDHINSNSYMYEPACGRGHIVEAVNAKRPVHHWYCADICEPYRDTVYQVNFFDHGFAGADVIMTNPPFTLFFEFAKRALMLASHVYLLGRLNVLGSGKKSGRHEWLKQHMPDVYVLPDRPCFAHKLKCAIPSCKGVMIAWDMPTPDEITCECAWPYPTPVAKRTAAVDSTEYAWFHWSREKQSRVLERALPGTITMLDCTHKSARVDRIITPRVTLTDPPVVRVAIP